MSGGVDRVWVHSSEKGTRIWIDNEFRGTDSVQCDLRRGHEYLLRGEKDGMVATEMRTTRTIDPSLIGNIFIGVAPVVIDLLSGNAKRLSRFEYDVTPRTTGR